MATFNVTGARLDHAMLALDAALSSATRLR